MTLDDYLKDRDLTPEVFAKCVGVTPQAVRNWLRGDRVPRPETMRRIEQASGGAVSPATFYASDDGGTVA